MTLSLADFIAKYTGQNAVGDTIPNMGQCVGLVSLWTDNLNLVHIWGNAADLLNNADKSAYTVVMNTPTNSPSAGDIVVFNMGQYGHCAVVVKADVNTLTVFEQNDHDTNDPSGACQTKDYNYQLVVGWAHPNTLPGTETIPVPQTLDEIQAQLKDALSLEGQCQTQLKTANQTIVTQQQNISDLVLQKQDLQKQLDDLQSKSNGTNTTNQEEIITLNAALEKLTKSNKDYATEAYESQQQTSAIGEYLYGIAQKLLLKIPSTMQYRDIYTSCMDAIDSLENQNNTCQKKLSLQTAVKNAISQKVSSLSPTNNPGFWTNIKNWIFVQK